MQKDDRQQLQQLIEDELKRVIAHVDELTVRCQPISPDNAIGRLSRMEAISERGVQQTALAAATERQRALEVSMARIVSDADYGLCENCDEPIPLARLMLMPESLYCVKCLDKD